MVSPVFHELVDYQAFISRRHSRDLPTHKSSVWDREHAFLLQMNKKFINDEKNILSNIFFFK